MGLTFLYTILFLGSLSGFEASKLKSWTALAGESIQEAARQQLSEFEAAGPYRMSEEDIQYVLGMAREGGDGQSRIEARRVRVTDEETGETYDTVYVNETMEEGDGDDVCHEGGDTFKPSLAVVQMAEDLLSTEYGELLSESLAAYMKIAEYFGQELYHQGAPVGSAEPLQPAHGDEIVERAENWSKVLNKHLVRRNKSPCPNAAEWLMSCIKATTCLLEEAVESDPHVFTPGRLVAYLDVEKEVEDHYQDFAFMAKLGPPNVVELCPQELSALEPDAGFLLTQLKAETKGATSERQRKALSAVAHLQRAANRTAKALAEEGIEQLAESFFTHTWKKTCEVLGCRESSFVDIMDSAAGHGAELIEVEASWHALKTHQLAFRQLRTAVKKALMKSEAFHRRFRAFFYAPGRNRGQKRMNSVYHQASQVLSTALALKRRERSGGNNDGGDIEAGWWCLGFKVTVTGGYGKKFPEPAATWGVSIGFKLLRGGVETMSNLLLGHKKDNQELQMSVSLTIGFVPDMPGVGGVRAGVSTGGKLWLRRGRSGLSLSMGLGWSAVTAHADGSWCGGPNKIGIFGCGGALSATLTIFCKDFDFTNGNNR